MEEEQYEAIIVNPDMREEDFVTTVNGSNIGVMELGKRLLLAAKEGNTESVRNLMKGGAPFATDWVRLLYAPLPLILFSISNSHSHFRRWLHHSFLLKV